MYTEEKEDNPCFQFEINLEIRPSFCCSYFNFFDSYQIFILHNDILFICLKPFKHALKTTDFCRKNTSPLISDLQPMG